MHIAGILLGCALLGQALDDTLPPGTMFEAAVPATASSGQETPSTFVQPAAAYAPVAPNTATTPAASAAVPTMSPQQPRCRTRPPEMVAEASLLPAGSRVTGKPLNLVDALSTTVDRRQQLEIVKSYWGLVQLVAEYRYCSDYAQALSSLKGRGGNDAVLRPAQTSAVAQVREAELNVLRWQYELAAMLRQSADISLPLPADRPHVGAYRTYFQELFAGRTAPEQARLAEKLLPLQRQMVDEHAAAVQATEDALGAVLDDYASGRTEAVSVVSCARELLTRRRAFSGAVCNYNRNIADYGLTVAGPVASPQSLVAMLIGPPQTSNLQTASNIQQPGQSFGTNPPAYQQPLRTAAVNEPTRANPATRPTPAGQGFAVPNGRNEPTLAPPRELPPNDAPETAPPMRSRNEPTPAPPREVWQNSGRLSETSPPERPADEPTLAPRRENAMAGRSLVGSRYDSIQPVDNEEPAAPNPPPKPAPSKSPTKVAPTPDNKAAGEPEKLREDPATEKPLAPPVEAKVPLVDPMPRMVRKPTLAASAASRSQAGNTSAAAMTPLYPALVDASPAARTKQLATALHWDRSLPAESGKPMSLGDCLWRDPNADKRATVEAYWFLRQRAAQYQVLVGEAEFYDALTQAVLDRRNEPSGPSDMLRLRAAQLAAQAAVREAQVALVESQYRLALRIGALADPIWPLASTVPHAGSYLLKLEVQPRGLAESWAVRRLAATIPRLGETVQQRAAAAVEADMARVATAEQYRTGGSSIESVLAANEGQREQTAAFLDSLTRYNASIAEYALAVLPPGTPADKIVSALVVQP